MLDPFVIFEKKYVRPQAGRTLIVGSKVRAERADRRQLYSNAVGWDSEAGEGVDVVVDLCTPFNDWANEWKPFDHIECISVLEHCMAPWLMAANLELLMAPGGTITVTVPFVWRTHNYPGDYWRFTLDGIRLLFPHIIWIAMRYGGHFDLAAPDVKLPTKRHNDQYYIARTQSFAFGVHQ